MLRREGIRIRLAESDNVHYVNQGVRVRYGRSTAVLQPHSMKAVHSTPLIPAAVFLWTTTPAAPLGPEAPPVLDGLRVNAVVSLL